jgi:hypothetical protein
MANSDLRDRLAEIGARASHLQAKAARFFSLGIAEGDDLKKFLYLFLSLEIETHAVFKRCRGSLEKSNMLSGAGDVASRATALLAPKIREFENLFDRFQWCATIIWVDVTDAEIDEFKEFKRVRDAIAHGDMSSPPGGLSRRVERLARKILWRA